MEVLTFGYILVHGYDRLEKIKVIKISISFCSLFTSVFVKVMFKLLQYVIFKE